MAKQETPQAPAPEPLLSKRGAVEYLAKLGLAITVKTLDAWRTAGKGPTSIRHGKEVRFDPRALRAWLYNDANKEPEQW